MAKLRAVKERKISNEVVANDLRGLGNTGLLENEYPWVYLAVKNLNPTLRDLVKETLSLQSKLSSDNQTTIFFDTTKGKDHKIKSVRMMGAALLINSVTPDQKMLIAQLDVLRFKVLNQSLEGSPESTTEDYKAWDQNREGLKVSFPLNVYLSHAGFKMSSESESVHLNATDLHHLITQKKSQSNSKAS